MSYTCVKTLEEDGSKSRCVVPLAWVDGDMVYWSKSLHAENQFKTHAKPDPIKSYWKCYKLLKTYVVGDLAICETVRDQYESSGSSIDTPVKKQHKPEETLSPAKQMPEKPQSTVHKTSPAKSPHPNVTTSDDSDIDLSNHQRTNQRNKKLIEESEDDDDNIQSRKRKKKFKSVSPKRKFMSGEKQSSATATKTPQIRKSPRKGLTYNVPEKNQRKSPMVTPSSYPHERDSQSSYAESATAYSKKHTPSFQNKSKYPLPEAEFQRKVLKLLLEIKTVLTEHGSTPVPLNNVVLERFTSVAELFTYEEKLTNDPNEFDQLIKSWSAIGGSNERNIIHNLLSSITDNTVLSKLNWEGTGNLGKSAFKNLPKIYKAITDVVILKYPNQDLCKVKAMIQKILRDAPDRNGGSRSAKKRGEASEN